MPNNLNNNKMLDNMDDVNKKKIDKIQKSSENDDDDDLLFQLDNCSISDVWGGSHMPQFDDQQFDLDMICVLAEHENIMNALQQKMREDHPPLLDPDDNVLTERITLMQLFGEDLRDWQPPAPEEEDNAKALAVDDKDLLKRLLYEDIRPTAQPPTYNDDELFRLGDIDLVEWEKFENRHEDDPVSELAVVENTDSATARNVNYEDMIQGLREDTDLHNLVYYYETLNTLRLSEPTQNVPKKKLKSVTFKDTHKASTSGETQHQSRIMQLIAQDLPNNALPTFDPNEYIDLGRFGRYAPGEANHDGDWIDDRRIFAIVGLVKPGSPAETAGLRTDDMVVEFGHLTASNFNDVQQLKKAVNLFVNRPLRIKVKRGRQLLNITVTPQHWDDPGLVGCQIIRHL